MNIWLIILKDKLKDVIESKIIKKLELNKIKFIEWSLWINEYD